MKNASRQMHITRSKVKNATLQTTIYCSWSNRHPACSNRPGDRTTWI